LAKQVTWATIYQRPGISIRRESVKYMIESITHWNAIRSIVRRIQITSCREKDR
jgi:hypothetical protein